MTDHTPASIQVTPIRTGRRRALLALIGTASLGIGAWLIVLYWNARVPDPSLASPDRLVAFIMSPRFNDLSDAERRAYSQQMVKRYADMDDDQRKLAEEEASAFAKENPDQVREQTIRFWKDYVVSEAEKYVEIPLEERQAYLEAKMAGWRMMFGGSDREADRKGGSSERQAKEEEEWAERLGPENQAKVNQFLQDEVLPRTSARDRALATLMMRDIGDMMR